MAHSFVSRLRQGRPPLLYAIVDARLCGAEQVVDRAMTLVESGVDLLQLRAKEIGAGVFAEWARTILGSCRQRGIPLIINDRVDVALSVEADGVHLGADDLPVSAARSLLGPDVLVGWTAHDQKEVVGALSGADYLGFGAVFPTQTRENSRIVGPEALTGARRATTLPIFAIGGIDAENLGRLGTYGIAGVAVASGLFRGRSSANTVLDLKKTLSRWP